MMLDQTDSALIDCDKAISLDPTLAEAYQTRGKVYVLLERPQEAKADLQKASELAEQEGNQELIEEINNNHSKNLRIPSNSDYGYHYETSGTGSPTAELSIPQQRLSIPPQTTPIVRQKRFSRILC